MSTVADVLGAKGSTIHKISDAAGVRDAVDMMNQHQVGALVVVNEDGGLAGIFTERDVLRRVLAQHRDPDSTIVGEVMTREVVCCEPEMSLEDVRLLMKDRRIRHMPVVRNGGELAGMVSIGDINAHYAQDHEVQLQYLREYINGRA